MDNLSADLAALPPEIRNPTPAPIDPAAQELAARQQEADAFRVLADRQAAKADPLAYQLAHTHQPGEGNPNADYLPVGFNGTPQSLAPPAPLPAPAPAAPPQLAPAPVAPAPAPAAPRAGGGGGASKPADLEAELVKSGKQGEAAIETAQAAKADAADKLGQAYEDLRVQQQADAQELRDKQEENRQRAELLDRQDAENLKKARDYVIPDFWKGREGALVGSVVTMAMGGIADAVLGGPNKTAAIINRNIDDYFQRQKEKVDNLYKYAEQQGKLDDRTRLRYAQELVDLKDQHAAVQQSVLSHINSVEKQNVGNVARAETDQLKNAFQQSILKSREESRVQRAHIAEMQSATAKNYAEAQKAKAEAAVAGTLKITEKLEGLAVRDPYTGEVRGYSPSTRQTKTIDDQLNASKQYVDALEELKANILSKGHLYNPWGDDAKLREQIFADAVAKGRNARGLGVSNANLALEHSAFGGSGTGFSKTITPEVIDNMIKDTKSKVAGIYKQLTPVSAYARQAAPGAAPPVSGGGVPAGLPPGSSATGRTTKDGRAVYRLPNGQLVAG